MGSKGGLTVVTISSQIQELSKLICCVPSVSCVLNLYDSYFPSHLMCYHICFGYRYSVEKIPLYDSAEDEPSSKLLKGMNSSNSEHNVDGENKFSLTRTVSGGSRNQFEYAALVVQPPDSVPMEDVKEIKADASEEIKLYSQDTQQAFSQKNAMISRIRSNSACRNYHISPGSLSNKKSKQYFNGRPKQLIPKQVDAKAAALLFASKEAQEEILTNEVNTDFSCFYSGLCKLICESFWL